MSEERKYTRRMFLSLVAGISGATVLADGLAKVCKDNPVNEEYKLDKEYGFSRTDLVEIIGGGFLACYGTFKAVFYSDKRREIKENL